MRSPTRTMAGNLRWTRSGTVWADWQLQALSYNLRSVKDKQVVRGLHQALIRALPGESLLQGISSGLDAAAVVERMIAGVDLSSCPDWAAECEATLDTLDAIGPGQRTFWLSVPLGQAKGLGRLREPWTSAMAGFRDSLALPRAGVAPDELARRLEQARLIAAAIPHAFRPRPATPAQMLWLHLHAQQRGALVDLDLPGTGDDLAGQLLTPRSGVALPEPLLDEGGQSDLPRRGLRSVNPLDRRYLKITQPDQPDTTVASYQALMVLTDVPAEGMLWPGSEFLGRIDESGVEVDWALRLQVRASADVAGKNRHALSSLNEQFGQREGELSHGLTVLDRAASELAEYASILESDKFEVEAQPTVIFAVASPDPTLTADRARALTDYLASSGYRLTRPVGYQEDLWWAMQPGVPANRAVREFAQITTSHALAAAVPLASTELGDDRGSLLALNISAGGPPGVVLLDLEGASGRDVSGSAAFVGELGSGKSFALKTLAGDVVDRGGRVVAIDRTPSGEYATWANSVTEATVVDVSEPQVSLDPLRLFGPEVGSRVTQTFLTPLLNIAPTSERGVLLSEVLQADYLAEHAVTSLGALRAHLAAGCTLPGASELARVMNVFGKLALGQVVFDQNLPVLHADAPAVVIRTHALQLPSREELTHKHLFEQMGLEKTLGRAIYALAAALARQVCFSDRSRLGVFLVDEAHHVTASPEGELEIALFVRDGRKHRAACLLGTHDPEADLGSATLRGLIPTRILMRHRDPTLAKRGLAYLGLDPDDDILVKQLTQDTSPVTPQGVEEHRRGEAFLRDASGNIGRIKVLAPALPHRNEAVRTTPPESAALNASPPA